MPPPGTAESPLATDLTPTLGPRVGAGVAPPREALSTDEARVDDRYELLAEQGRGGLGRVMRARDRRLGRLVAVKELLRTSELGEQLFLREAMITARLEHPGIVPVHEAGRWTNGDPFYVMKLVSGRTLKEVLAAATTTAERLALLPHLIAACEAVGYAHSEQVVHRDLKPANVLIGEFGETVVIDWGLARDLRVVDAVPLPALGSSPPSLSATVTGRVIGTPQYMPPEQARGEAVGPAADVYALGAMLYELLAGRPPIEGDSVQAMLAQVHAGPPRALAAVAPGVPADLEAIVVKAMARDVAERYPTARELAADLKRYQTGKLVTAQHYGTWRLVRRWIVRHRGYVAMAALAMVAIAAVAIALVWRVLDERREAQARRVEAEAARAEAQAGQHALVIAQATAAVASDPTTALAWLKRYPIDDASAPAVRALVDEAEAAGVARHVWPLAERPRGAVLARDGRYVAIGQADGRLRVFDVATGRARQLGDGRAAITALAGRADGGLAVGDASGRVAVLDLATGRRVELATVAGVRALHPLADGGLVIDTGAELIRCDETGAVTPLFPPGRHLQHLTAAWDGRAASVRLGHGADGAVRRWRGDGPGEVVARVPGMPHRLIVTDDGAVALVATTTALHRVDLATGAVKLLRALDAEVNQIVLDPAQRRAALVGGGPEVILIDLADGAVDVLRGHADGVFEAAFAADGARLVTAGDEGTVRVWDLVTGDTRELRGHTDDVLTVAITADGRTVLSTSYDDSMRLWHLDARRAVVVGHLDQVRTVAALGGDRVRVLSLGQDARLVDVDLAARTTELRLSAPGVGVNGAALTRDGSYAVFRRSPTEYLQWRDGESRVIRLPATAAGVRFARDGAIFTVDDQGRVWHDAGAGAAVLAQVEPGGTVMVRADGGAVLLRDRERFAVIDRTTGAELDALTRAELGLSPLATAGFLPDEARVVIAGDPDVGVGMRLWDPARGTVVTLANSVYAYPVSAVSPDGRRVAAGVESRAVRVWDATTGAELATLRGHRDGVFDLAFSPDGARLASASYDRTARVWELASGDSRVLSGHGGPVWSLAWLGDAELVTASADGSVRRWSVAPVPAPDAAALRARIAGLTAVEIAAGQRARTPS